MNIRRAILAAAEHIERNPVEFRFSSIMMPDGPGCGTPGCAIGWIGCFANVGKAADAFFRASAFASLIGWRCILLAAEGAYGFKGPLQVDTSLFYSRMDSTGVRDWRCSADRCAEALRLYADKYHPAAEPAYPNWQAIAAGDKVKDSARDQALDWVRA